METWLIALIVVIVILVIAVIAIVSWCISTRNTFKVMKVKVDESASGIDVALTKRFDLLTKTLAATKGYAKHETEILEKVVSLRSGDSIKEMSMKDKNALTNEIAEASRGLNILVEQYPNLKADSTFIELQRQTADCEEQLQAARRIYNSNVSTFNQKRNVWPSSIIANRIGFKEDLDFFEAEEEKKKDVKFDF